MRSFWRETQHQRSICIDITNLFFLTRSQHFLDLFSHKLSRFASTFEIKPPKLCCTRRIPSSSMDIGYSSANVDTTRAPFLEKIVKARTEIDQHSVKTDLFFLFVARRVSLTICCVRPRRRRRRRRRSRRRRSAVRPPPTSTANQDVARPVTVIRARAMVR